MRRRRRPGFHRREGAPAAPVAADIIYSVCRSQTTDCASGEPDLSLASPLDAFTPISVEARDLTCVRGGRLVFSGLSFRVKAGQLLTLIGPNGAGKSTLLRVVAGLLAPEAGTLRISGATEAEGVAHFLGHADGLKAALSLRETLAFWSVLYGWANGLGGEGALATAAEEVGLSHALDLPVAVLSAGQRKRAALARLLVAPRPLWLLDEPTSALDRAGAALLGGMMASHLAKGGAIVAASHDVLPVMADATLDLAQPA